MLFDGVIPFTVKGLRVNTEGFHINVRHLDSRGVAIRIQGGTHPEPRPRRCGFNQVDNHLVVDERTTTPVQADGTEQPVLYLVPFAGAGRKMTDVNLP